MKKPRALVQKKAFSIHMTKAQQMHLAALRQEAAVLNQRFSDYVSAVTAGHADAVRLTGWGVQVTESTIELTPPAKQAPHQIRSHKAHPRREP